MFDILNRTNQVLSNLLNGEIRQLLKKVKKKILVKEIKCIKLIFVQKKRKIKIQSTVY